MVDSSAILCAVLPVYLIIGTGWFLRRTHFLSRAADATLLSLTINVLTPCLALDSMLGNRALQNVGATLSAPFLGMGSILFGMAVCFVLAPLAGLKKGPEQRTFAVSAGIYNWSYLALPVVLALYGKETVGVLFVYNLGLEITLWTVAIMVISGGAPGQSWRRLFNPPVLAILTSLILNLLHGENWIPRPLLSANHMLGTCAFPLGLMLVGATLYDHTRTGIFRGSVRTGLLGCVLRVGILPLGMLALAHALPLTPELKAVLLVQAAMPSAVFPILMAQHYGGSPVTALRVVLATSIAGIVTIPFWVRLGQVWLMR